jgi:acyl-coenzyme A thioesterase PaaI-like protein
MAGAQMSPPEIIKAEILDILRGKLGDRIEGYQFPPPVFAALEGSFQELDLDRGYLRTRFPVLDRFLNPFGAFQGGMIAAAVDNTLGPLSFLVAPPNVTRELGLTYSHPVRPEMGYFDVSANFIRRDGRWLYFNAEVRAPDQKRLVRARAVHYIIEL